MASTRFEYRLPVRLKKMVEEAANLLGVTVAEFTKRAVSEKAEKVCQRQNLLMLANQDRDLLMAALDAPPKAIPKLTKEFEWYEKIHERK